MRRRWGCWHGASGCGGLLFGAVTVFAIEIYIGVQVAGNISEQNRLIKENGPTQRVYDSMCASSAKDRDPVLKGMCDRMVAEMKEAKERHQRQARELGYAASQRAGKGGQVLDAETAFEQEISQGGMKDWAEASSYRTEFLEGYAQPSPP